jgi:hypothetical protein
MQQSQLNITLDKTVGAVCENCGNDVFAEGLFLRKASKFLTGTERDAIIPIPAFYCVKCHHVNSEFKPQGYNTEE